MSLRQISSAIALSLLATVAPAHAAPAVTFDFHEFDLGKVLDVVKSSVQYSNASGLTLSITPVSSADDEKLTINWSGIGVSLGLLDNGNLDGSGTDEALFLQFSAPVKLDSLDLAGFSKGFLGVGAERVQILSLGVTHVLDNNSASTQGDVTTFALSGLPVSSIYLIQPGSSLSDFRLAGLTATVVPEPSTLAMLGLGLAGIAAVRRRRVQPDTV